jgi:hypothetical protein
MTVLNKDQDDKYLYNDQFVIEFPGVMVQKLQLRQLRGEKIAEAYVLEMLGEGVFKVQKSQDTLKIKMDLSKKDKVVSTDMDEASRIGCKPY